MEELLSGAAVLTVVIIIISALCTVVGLAGAIGAVIYFMGRSQQQRNAVAMASMAWSVTKGKVIKSRVEVSGSDYVNTSPHVVYEYEVNGVRYENDQLRAGYGSSTSIVSPDPYKVIDFYPEGKEVDVFFDPQNHAVSALERKI